MRWGRKQAPVERVIEADEPIARHRWLSCAVATPALRVVQGGSPDQQVFGFHAGAARLVWVDGRVVVTGAAEGDLPDLVAVAEQLGGRVVG